jgi:hypothetical protein
MSYNNLLIIERGREGCEEGGEGQLEKLFAGEMGEGKEKEVIGWRGGFDEFGRSHALWMASLSNEKLKERQK